MTNHLLPKSIELPSPPAGYDCASIGSAPPEHLPSKRRFLFPDDAERYGEACAISLLAKLWPCKICDCSGDVVDPEGMMDPENGEWPTMTCYCCEGMTFNLPAEIAERLGF